jgi:uncharacterized protein (DUF1810 family)
MVADFSRFVDAQKATFEKARVELIAGAKISHWMWYIFPQQFSGHGYSNSLGSSSCTRRSRHKGFSAFPMT